MTTELRGFNNENGLAGRALHANRISRLQKQNRTSASETKTELRGGGLACQPMNCQIHGKDFVENTFPLEKQFAATF